MKYLICFSLCALAIAGSNAQSFNFHSLSPFGIQTNRPDSSKAAFFYRFIDYDQDDDLDLILAGIDSIGDFFNLTHNEIFYFVDYQENIGDKKHPVFADRVALVEDFPFVPGFFVPALGDLDNDGRVDMVVSVEVVDSSLVQHMLYYHQRADGGFDVQRLTDLGIDPIIPRSSFLPELTDLDLDGDLDLLMTGWYPSLTDITITEPYFLYAKNIGNASSPEFLGWFENPYGLSPGTLSPFSASGDIDNDGDMDLLRVGYGDSISIFAFLENIPGLNGKPAYQADAVSPFGLPAPVVGQVFVFPTLVDLDGDDDLDLIVLRDSDDDLAGLNYFENTLSPSGVREVTLDMDQLITVVPNPARETLSIINESPFAINAVQIFDAAGILVQSTKRHTGKSLNISDLRPGIYLIRITLENKAEVVKKVVIAPD